MDIKPIAKPSVLKTQAKSVNSTQQKTVYYRHVPPPPLVPSSLLQGGRERSMAKAEENVILVRFEEESKAYQAANVLKGANADGRIILHAVAVLQRMEGGALRVKEGDADALPVATWTTSAVGAATGGLIGLTLGTQGGPLGVLLGGAWGMLLGSLVDLAAAEEATRAAEEEARRKLREERKAEVKGEVQQKLDQLKAKVSGG